MAPGFTSQLSQRFLNMFSDMFRAEVEPADPFPLMYIEDALSEDALDVGPTPIALPPPELGRLFELEQIVRGASTDPHGRDALAKAVINEDYIAKLIPLVSIAEDLESLDDLHRLCNIMKMVILLNDTAIMERVVADDLILGVVGALECELRRPWQASSLR